MEAGKLTHSHSQPGGMDRTPPGTPKKGGKMLAVRVQMLDDTITMFQVQAKALGRVLFDQVCNQLNLLESDYFGLEYQEVGGTKYWLDLEKPLSRQIGLSLVDTLVRFCVKFYTPDPSQLEEEYTRYLFCLQIKRDLSQGLLQCNSNTAALLASYIVQAECGDYVVEDYPDHRYLSSYKFVPNQDQELERRIMENHKKHAGQSPAEADLNLLETARRCELYGIKMHPAKDHDGAPLNLAVAHMGIVVFQNYTKINTFSWAKIRKISFKRKRFLVKLHPEGYGHYKDTVEFFFEGRNECKNFWKKCVENHGFFRCTMVKKVPRQKTRVLSRGSSFRYSGRTQKQIVDFVRENYVKRQTFQRSQSFRHSSSAHSSVANVGTSISAHPLLPLGDNAVAGTPASLSCGSMTLTSSPLHTADIHAGGSPSPPLTTSVSPGTSVTSSPQHFYPQETPYRRPGLQPTKMKHPHVHSHRVISPLQSPTDAATLASNRSANLSNNIVIDGSDIKSSRISLKSPDYSNFNDVYSTSYSSLRSSRTNVDSKINGNDTKTDIFDLMSDFITTTNKSNESKVLLPKKLKPYVCKKSEEIEGCSLPRSASFEDLYHEKNLTESEKSLPKELDPNCDINFDFLSNPYGNLNRKCYSAVASKNPSIDRTGDVISDMKIYSSSYPGTTSSLSTESAEGESDDRIIEVVGSKYRSQEEMVLSHDDVSHDSYELLERELDVYDDDLPRAKSRRGTTENERARSCSWGSDRGMASIDSRSTENVVGVGYTRSTDNSFWSLEKERSPKHKSEIDFRSLNYKTSKSNRNSDYWIPNDDIRRGSNLEFFEYDTKYGENLKEENLYASVNRIGQFENRILKPKTYKGREVCQNFDQETRLQGLKDERQKYQGRRKSVEELLIFPDDLSDRILKGKHFRLEERQRFDRKRDKRDKEERFHEGIKEKEQKEWEKERERRVMGRRKNVDEKSRKNEEEMKVKSVSKPNDYVNFQEIQLKKFDRVISNQFGRYSEFLPQDNTFDFLEQEKKVMENYEKICQVGRMAKQLEENERSSFTSNEYFKTVSEMQPKMEDKKPMNDRYKDLILSPKIGSKLGKAIVERTKSDPFHSNKNQKRNILMHQKSIDLTPQQSEEGTSDYDNEDLLKKTSRSEHDIPYILHKRHCMNGTARNKDSFFNKDDLKRSFGDKSGIKENKIVKPIAESKKPSIEEKIINLDGTVITKQKSVGSKVIDSKKYGVQIINLDVKNDVSIIEPKRVIKGTKTLTKKVIPSDSNVGSSKNIMKKEVKKVETCKSITSVKKDIVDISKSEKPAVNVNEDKKEPIYAEVCKEKLTPPPIPKTLPPELPKRILSATQTLSSEESGKQDKLPLPQKVFENANDLPKPPKRTTSVQKQVVSKFENGVSGKVSKSMESKPIDSTKDTKRTKKDAEDIQKSQLSRKSDLPFTNSALQRREESLTLFARTRLGLSEGSAFTPIVRQTNVGSPAPQRRTRSLDAPYVSLHSLPPVDAFSSKDDTVDVSESDIVHSAATRAKELLRAEIKSIPEKNEPADTVPSTESEVDSVFLDNTHSDVEFKKTVESQSKVEMPYTEEKVLDSVRNKRLLSKIESVDVVDSEGDLDSSKMADPLPIPSDRLVNLPESIRFPSVRQISGQTSEESADGWDQKEVKVKRRTPRRSTGREDTGNEIKESVVWDSKDDEPPEDDVWDDNLVFTGKYEGSAITDAVVPVEYLKRGSCGQSIDDDNLSTPMKESSPEHWVSVDDLPEALEKEEKLLKQQEKILKEKILNEKLKRELNLDTIDVDERYYEYKDSLKPQKVEEDSFGSKEKFKGHSLDTYELNEKKSRERGTVKNSSLDEHLLGEKLLKNYTISSSFDSDQKSSYENIIKAANYEGRIDYIQCKVVNDVTEIDQFGDNDEELEEFFVVLDESFGNDKERKDLWGDDETLKRSLSKDESLISVPDEFKDVEKESEEEKPFASVAGKVEITLCEAEERGKRLTGEEHILAYQLLQEKLDSVVFPEIHDDIKDDSKPGLNEVGRLSPYSGSRRGSEEQRKHSASDDTGRLSPYDCLSRRSSDDPRRLSASDDAGRLSPYNDSRRGSEDPRRLSTSEDSRKYSMSESVSEETRRRLSSTEETRRKRASLTKQCSVGADSLSDEIISGIQECSSSFEHDEKDVFEADPVKPSEPPVLDIKRQIINAQNENNVQFKNLEIEVSEDISTNENLCEAKESENVRINGTYHLAPPASERELSRETEDSVDYCEGDFKDIRDIVKDKDISEGLICDGESAKLEIKTSKLPSSFEKSESSEGDELRYIDEKRGSTPEIIVGKSKEAVSTSIVVVNEGISVLNKISETGSWINEAAKAQSLPREILITTVNEQDERHTLPKKSVKPKPLSSKPIDHVYKKLAKAVPNVKIEPSTTESIEKETVCSLKGSLDSSQESEIDKLGDLSLISQVQSQIARRNLLDTGKDLKQEDFELERSLDRKTSSEEDGMPLRTSSEEREKTESSSFDLKSSADELFGDDGKWRGAKGEKKISLKPNLEISKIKKDHGFGVGKEKRSPERRDSGEDGSSSSSAHAHPKRELSSTWKPFLLESSGSSSLEEGWLPPDDNAHLADEEETSSTSNNQQDDSYHDDIDYPTGIGYPVLSMTSAEMMVSGYGGVYGLSRTLSRISERSTSEQERSEIEDDITKPSSHSVSAEEESMLSSDHQPSLSSDPPSPREAATGIPDLPDDHFSVEGSVMPDNKKTDCEPFNDIIPPPVPDEDWPSPPSSSSVVDTPLVSHVETFYMEIHPEEACKVVVAELNQEGNSSSDENQTLQEESEFLHLSSDNISVSTTTTTTQDGTVIVPVRPKSMRTGSIGEDSSVISTSEWSNSTVKSRPNPNFGTNEDLSDWSSSTSHNQSYYLVCDERQALRDTESSTITKHLEESLKPKVPLKIRPPKLISPTTKNIGFFETPVSKVRSPTSQIRFFEEKSSFGYATLRSPTSHSETTSPKNHGRFFEISSEDLRFKGNKYYSRKETKSSYCIPYYSNVADSAEKSYFGRYDTGSLERTKIHSSRKCCSYYSVSKTVPNEEDSDGSNSEGPPPTSANTIPRASKRSRKRHRVAMDLEIRDGKIVAPPKTRTTVIDNSDSDRSSPRDFSARESRKKQSDV